MTRHQNVHPTAIVAGCSGVPDNARVGPYAVVGAEGSDPVVIGDGVEIGAHATVLPGIRIGRCARVLGNSFVDSDVPPLAVVGGVPAAILGYIDPITDNLTPAVRASTIDAAAPLDAGGASLVPLRAAHDLRGALVVGEFADLPFIPQRFFAVHDVASGNVRGEHAHRKCAQFLVALNGSVRCIVDDGATRREALLDTPSVGLHLPPMVWGTQFGHSSDAVLLVLASLPYDDLDYIREYEQFLTEVREAH